LTLTTFEPKQADGLRYLFRDTREAKRMQYVGVEDGNLNWFIGKAKQNYEDHWMFQASGEAADVAFDPICDNWVAYDWSVTRIDLQITIPLPAYYQSRQLYDDIEAWSGDGRPRRPSLVQSGDGNDTVYIGSRTSNRFIRIYVKPLDEGKKALRMEVEYKRELAHRVFHDCRNDRENVTLILAHELSALPALKNGVKEAFFTVLGPHTHKPQEKRATGENSTLEWLRKQVDPAIKRMLNSHEFGDATRQIVASWYTYGQVDTN
jgi:hypothetical protein